MEKQITIKIRKSAFDDKPFITDDDKEDITSNIAREIIESFKSVIEKLISLKSFEFTDRVKRDMEKKKRLLPTNFESFKQMGFEIEVK